MSKNDMTDALSEGRLPRMTRAMLPTRQPGWASGCYFWSAVILMAAGCLGTSWIVARLIMSMGGGR